MFAATVAEYRQRIGLSQDELADRSGLSVRTIRDLEAGRVLRPRPMTVRLLADSFGLSGDDRGAFCAAALAPDGGSVALEKTRADQPPRRPPAQLPAGPVPFTGRSGPLRRLHTVLSRTRDEPASAPSAVVVSGTAGVGKTALVVHWAHGVADSFYDGHLYVNLRGYAPAPPVRVGQALTHLLSALGVALERIPADEDEAAGLYRTELAERQLLVVLDNAANADQVRPLLPGGGHSLAVITSRNRLSGLVAVDGAQRIALDPLPRGEANDLLATLVGRDRADREPDAVDAIVEACDGLPLALRIAAANLADQQSATIAEYARTLVAGRVAALRVIGDDQAAVGAAFDLSYRSLDAEARRMFRLLGIDPSVDTTPSAAAALAGAAVGEARHLLDSLANAHLTEQTSPGRYSVHDLIRRYAGDRARSEDSARDRRAAIERLLTHYLRLADGAAGVLYPHVLRLPRPEREPARQPWHAGPDQALAWLDAEQPNLVTATVHAAGHGPRPAAWLLSDALRGHFSNRLHAADWLTTATAGLSAATLENDAYARASAYSSLALRHWRLGRYGEAVDQYTAALDHAREAGWLEGQAATLNNLGAVLSEQGRYQEAVSHYDKALALHLQTGRLPGQAAALTNLGTMCLQLGRLAAAVDHIGRALDIYERLGSEVGKAVAGTNLGEVYHLMGDSEAAHAQLSHALAGHRQAGNRANEADTMACLARVHRTAARYDEAFELAAAAVATAQDAGHRLYQAVTISTLASIHDGVGEHAEALALYTDSVRLASEVGHRYAETEARIGLASATLHLGRPEAATEHLGRALAAAREAGHRLLEGQALTVLLELQLELADVDANRTTEQALAIYGETGHQPGVAHVNRLLARFRR